MLVKDFECRSFKQAKELLGVEQSKTVCNNTVLYNDSMYCRVRVALHGHTIVQLYIDGRIELDSCRHKTRTTKDRINKCLPYGMFLYQKQFSWFIKNVCCTAIPFVDGMNVGTGGDSVIVLGEALELTK